MSSPVSQFSLSSIANGILLGPQMPKVLAKGTKFDLYAVPSKATQMTNSQAFPSLYFGHTEDPSQQFLFHINGTALGVRTSPVAARFKGHIQNASIKPRLSEDASHLTLRLGGQNRIETPLIPLFVNGAAAYVTDESWNGVLNMEGASPLNEAVNKMLEIAVSDRINTQGIFKPLVLEQVKEALTLIESKGIEFVKQMITDILLKLERTLYYPMRFNAPRNWKGAEFAFGL